MKRPLLILGGLVFLVLLSGFRYSFKPFEGDITYSITYVELPEESRAFEDMLANELFMTLGKSNTKVQQELMGGSQVIVANNADKTGEMMMEMMGMKIHVHLSKEELEAENNQSEKPVITEFKEYKKILGYKCQKAVLKTSTQTIELWYTDKIEAQHTDFKDIKGFPLEYLTTQGDMKVKMTATKVESRNVEDSEFNVPDGFTTYTMEELSKMMGGN